jgi:hypothetical protein
MWTSASISYCSNEAGFSPYQIAHRTRYNVILANPGVDDMRRRENLSKARPMPESAHHTQLRRAIIASTVGTTIEWYDFLLYSVVTGLVFGKLFFPDPPPEKWSDPNYVF